MKTLDCPVKGLMYAMRAVSPALGARLMRYLTQEEEFVVSSKSDSYFRAAHRGRMPKVLAELREVAEFFQTEHQFDRCEIRRSMPGVGLPPCTLPGVRSVVVFTLQGGCTVVFKRGTEEYRLYAEPWSMYILTGDALTQWERSVEPRMVDDVGEVRHPRVTRYEVEFHPR